MNIIDQLLEKRGVKEEDLNASEIETINSWREAIQKAEITVPKIREYISAMKEAVEKELTRSNIKSKKDMFLKARLRNYLLLEALMSTPDKAKKRIEEAIAGLNVRT